MRLLLTLGNAYFEAIAGIAMSKRSGAEAVKAVAKRPNQSKSFESYWEDKINTADLSGCKLIQTKLEHLLSLTKARIANLQANEDKRGLNYKGEDAVKCGCDEGIQSNLMGIMS